MAWALLSPLAYTLRKANPPLWLSALGLRWPLAAMAIDDFVTWTHLIYICDISQITRLRSVQQIQNAVIVSIDAARNAVLGFLEDSRVIA